LINSLLCEGRQNIYYMCPNNLRDRRGRDRMVVGFTTIYTISAYHHWWSEFKSLSGRCVQHYV